MMPIIGFISKYVFLYDTGLNAQRKNMGLKVLTELASCITCVGHHHGLVPKLGQSEIGWK